jgi:hypothetical protein
MQHAKRMRRYALSSLAYLAVPYFTILSPKRHDFRKKVVERKACVLMFSTNLSGEFLILRIIQRDIVINVHTTSCKVPVILARS